MQLVVGLSFIFSSMGAWNTNKRDCGRTYGLSAL
jgi:hypothetical protein